MARRKTSLLDDLVVTLSQVPAWLSVAFGLVVYAGLELILYVLSRNALLALSPDVTKIVRLLALFYFAIIALGIAAQRWRRRDLIQQQTGLDTLRRTSWQHFEWLVAEAYSRNGYMADYSLESGADGGVDIVLTKQGKRILVQCKRWRNQSVAVNVVREMFGILHDQKADEVIIVTTHFFTADAVSFARNKPITLVDGPALWQLVREVQTNQKVADVNAPAAAVSEGKVEVSTPVLEMKNEPPECPLCQRPMIHRQAKRGATAGSWFWGCSRYPQCKGTRSC